MVWKLCDNEVVERVSSKCFNFWNIITVVVAHNVRVHALYLAVVGSNPANLQLTMCHFEKG